VGTNNVKVVSCALALIASLAFSACSGGGSRSNTVPQPAPTSTVSGSGSSSYTGVLANVTFSVRIPGTTTSGNVRRPSYVSSATKSIKVVMSSPPTGFTTPIFNTGTLPNAACPASGSDFVCTFTIGIPPGSDTLTFSLYDATNGTGNILSAQVGTFSIVVGTTNSFNVTFDANAAVMTVNGSQDCQNGPVGTVFGSVGSSPVTFTVSYTDAAGKTIVAPGLPTLAIQDNTATYQTTSGTLNGTGGTVGFTINQSTQTFVLTPSNSTTTGVTVNVRATPANSNSVNDSLSFSTTKSYTFATGTAPPTHNFLAAVEQIGTNTGQVDFFNITLGGSGGPDTFSAFSPATLAVTNSTNESKPDVDNPLSLAWDANGGLLIGNSHNGGPNAGNLACVPVGAIATGLNSATTTTANVTVPVALAYDSRDGSVAIADAATTGNDMLSEYLLTGNYTAAGSSRNLHVTGLGALSVVNLPTQTAGTYAVSLTDGCEVDSAHSGNAPCPASGTSKVAILSPTGTETDITNPTSPTTFAVDKPWGLAWDAANSQLVIANNSGFHPSVSFYTVGPFAQQKVIATTGAGPCPCPRPNTLVAASPDGHIAVAQLSDFGSGYMMVQVYGNTASRSPVGGPIPFNSVDTQGNCQAGPFPANYLYGADGATVNALTWLSNTKLLIGLLVTSSGVYQSSNGLYIYDISATAVPAGVNDEDCNAFAAAPVQSGFHQLSKTPFGVAFKP
jgi:hypothetical protein